MLDTDGVKSPLKQETTFVLSFITRESNGDVLLYREKIAEGERFHSFTFANLVTFVPKLPNLKGVDLALLGDFRPKSEQDISAESIQQASGFKLGRDIQLKRSSKKLKWKVEGSCIQAFHYTLLFNVEEDPARAIRCVGYSYSFLPLSRVIRSTENPLIKAGLRLVFLPRIISSAIDRLKDDRAIGESNAVTVALTALKDAVKSGVAHAGHELIDWPYELPEQPKNTGETNVLKWKMECHEVSKKNWLFALINISCYHLLQARPTSLSLPIWLAEVVDLVAHGSEAKDVDQAMLELTTAKFCQHVIERHQISMHAQTTQAVRFLTQKFQDREILKDKTEPLQNILVVISPTASVLRVVTELVGDVASSAGLFTKDSLTRLQLVIGEGRPNYSGVEICKKLFEHYKNEKQKLRDNLGGHFLSPDADATRQHATFNLVAGSSSISLDLCTDACLSAWVTHALLAGQRPALLCGAASFTPEGHAVVDSGCNALAHIFKANDLPVVVMGRTDSIGIREEVFTEMHKPKELINSWMQADSVQSKTTVAFLHQATTQLPVLNIHSFKHDLLPGSCILAYLCEHGAITHDEFLKHVELRKSKMARLE